MTELLRKARIEYYNKCIWGRIPKRYAEKTVSNFEGKKEIVSECLVSVLRGESVFISGKCGVGKTHLAVGLLKEWLHKRTLELIKDTHDYPSISNTNPIFLPSVDLFLELKNTFNNDGQSEKDVIDAYVQAGLLVIDDVGAEKVSDWSRQMFYLIVDRRYRNMKPTIITSNLSLQQISETIDERISSRICEMGVATELTGKDRRLQ
jgi:DNA replication protein DnaC